MSFNVVAPIFLLMVVGFFLKKIKILSEKTVKEMNAAVFKVFLPAMIIKNVYESEISEVFNPGLVLFAVVSVIATAAIIFCVVPLFVKDESRRGVIIQGMFRANFVIFGIPVSEAVCGGSVSGSAAVLIAVIVPIFNFMAVIALEIFNGGKPDFLKVLKGIVKNPLIISSVLGLAVNFFGVKAPSVIEATVKNLSSIATPLALVFLGASINLKAIEKNTIPLIWTILVKLVLLPAVCLTAAAYIFGIRGADFVILISLFASPTAVSSFTMAQQMGGDSELAGQIVMFGTVVCAVTVFLWIFSSMQLGII